MAGTGLKKREVENLKRRLQKNRINCSQRRRNSRGSQARVLKGGRAQYFMHNQSETPDKRKQGGESRPGKEVLN